MKNFKQSIFQLLCLVFLSFGCREPFEPEISSYNHNLLVVEGYIEVGGGETTISLGRTRPVYDSISLNPILGATVQIESGNGSIWPLTEQGDGIYRLLSLLPEEQDFRLSIETGGREYLSDWVMPIISPDISEITFEKIDGDVAVYTNTFGNENARYFLWEFEESWVYRSAYRASYKYVPEMNDMVPLKDNELTYKCWQYNNSKRVILASSERYQNGYIHQKEILKIESLSEKLGERYSVLVRQKAIDQEAFVFWEAIRKNSDDIGGIFSPLPSLISSNVYNVNDPDEPVIGYVSAGKSAEKRLYINRREVDPWRAVISDYNNCYMDTIAPHEYKDYILNRNYVPLHPYCVEAGCYEFFATTAYCADCSMRGGFLQKPEFWED